MYAPDTFDYVHVRNLGQAISDWASVLGDIRTALKPGAYVELSENGGECHADDDSLAPGHGTVEWFALMGKGMLKLGRPERMHVALLEANLRAAGFVDVVTKRIKLPLTPWAKDKDLKRVGAMNLLSSETGYGAYGMSLFTKCLGLSTEEAKAVCDKGLHDARTAGAHIYQF